MAKTEQRLKKQNQPDTAEPETLMTRMAASRDTAIQLLTACVATEVRCVAEVVRHVRADPKACKELLEHMLVVQQDHAQELVNVLRMHRVVA